MKLLSFAIFRIYMVDVSSFVWVSLTLSLSLSASIVGCHLGEAPYTVECYQTQTNLPCRNSELFVTNRFRCCTWLNCIMITALKVISLWFWFCFILWLHWFYVHLCYGGLFCWSVRGVYWLVCGGTWVWCVWRWGVCARGCVGVGVRCVCVGCVCVCVCVCAKSFFFPWMLLNGFLSLVDWCEWN